MWRDGRRDDERHNAKEVDLGGYRHQGSLEIAAPEALYAVGFGRKLRKNPSRASAGFAGRPRFGYTIDEDEERTREETNCPLKRVRSTYTL